MSFALATITGKRCHWLLDVTIGGGLYRYADEALEVTDHAGNV